MGTGICPFLQWRKFRWGGGAIAPTSRRIANLSEIFILSEVRRNWDLPIFAVAEISVGWGGQLPPPLVELPICRKFSFYRKFGNT